ncbi:SDR family oxidoreductase [Gracilinema caldarium]|uniref:SDR family oxidoreductase n=1 Tax=Gracilinema caldarium TaxID=215591 RepID=UPI0026EBF677|nr:SDR family oxidoreductase [Gracilinema caldarium]
MNILITGANRGLGLALCKIFLVSGHRVFAFYRSKGETLEKLANEQADHNKAHLVPIQCDVTDEAQLRTACDRIQAMSPSLDILINNAAVHLEQNKPDIDELDFSVYLPTLEVNAVAPLMTAVSFLPLLRAGTKKCIINISSEAGSIGSCWRDREYAYCMSKAAFNMGMRILQNRLKDEQFRIRLIHPGWVRTDMGGSNAELSPEESAQAVFNQIMLTIQSPAAAEMPLYIDWEGKPLAW